MPVSVLTLHAMRSLLEKAIDLLQQVIALIDKSIASEQSIAPEVGIPTTAPGRRGPEIRHYCVWAFPRGAPLQVSLEYIQAKCLKFGTRF